MKNKTHLLKSRRFLPLFITQFFGAFNDNAFKNAFLIWYTYDVATRSGADAATMVTMAAGLFILPFFIFSATAGQVADKYEKSWLTQKMKQIEIVLMIACAIGFFLDSVTGLLILLFLMGTQSTFFSPIKLSLLPDHLRDDELISGNAWIGGGTFLSILLGTIFGGLIILTEHGVELLSITVVVFAIVGWISSRYIPTAPLADVGLKVGWNIASETWKIVGYAREERSVWLSIIGISYFWLTGSMFLTQFPVYVQRVIGGNEHIVTLFLTTFSIGIGLGSLWCNRLLKGKIDGRLVPYASIGMCISIVMFVIASGFYETPTGDLIGLGDFFAAGGASWGIVLSLFVLAVCAGVYIVPLYTIMQHRTDGHYLARVIAANNVVNALFVVLASVGVVALFAFGFTVTEVLFTVGVVNIHAFFVVRAAIKRQ